MTNYKPTISTPCNENWENMAPENQGRFCAMCTKNVIDFTAMTDSEVQNYLLENRNSKVCGRFNPAQLDTVVINIPRQVLFAQTSFRKCFLLALLVTMGTVLLSCEGKPVIGQIEVPKVAERDSIPDFIMGDIDDPKIHSEEVPPPLPVPQKIAPLKPLQ
ncbi:MAG: hypothetical protein EOO45_22695 [Flavobacterium sp.]|nr:MAG: hypothetical protein EOO45_22695 [Flavobacterium sp.]